MALSKKKKIKNEFFDLIDDYEDARERLIETHAYDDILELLECRRRMVEYARAHQQALEISDEIMQDLIKGFENLEKDVAETKRSKARVQKAEREYQKSKRNLEKKKLEYYDMLLDMPPQGKQRTGH